ncbi:hypothetical protein FHT44_005095 [Mycolicibacterium sp. BK634]|nr:hypothetical protein [Mycolicibacterium sp. BK634]
MSATAAPTMAVGICFDHFILTADERSALPFHNGNRDTCAYCHKPADLTTRVLADIGPTTDETRECESCK